jgi:hypothetical protein
MNGYTRKTCVLNGKLDYVKQDLLIVFRFKRHDLVSLSKTVSTEICDYGFG